MVNFVLSHSCCYLFAETGRLWQSQTLTTSLQRQLQISSRLLSAEAAKEESADTGDEYHSIIKDTEKDKGD